MIFLCKILTITHNFKPFYMNNRLFPRKQLKVKSRLSFLIVSVLFAVTTGCSTFQYAALDSDLQKNENNAFVNENDTVKILYTFNGQDCPVNIQVYNKFSKPIYIDWSKSAVILNGERISYWMDQSQLVASSTGHTYRWTKNASTTSSDIDGTIYRDEKISFIPPKSFMEMSRIQLHSAFFKISKNDSLQTEYFATSQGSDKRIRHIFNQNNTPLSFRSYLTLSTSDDFTSESNYDNHFWVSSVAKSSYNPNALINKPANQFYMQKASVAGKILSWTAAIAAIALLAIYGGEQ